MTKYVKLPLSKRRVNALYLGALLLVIVASVGAYAASVGITTLTVQGEQGVYLNDNAYYTIAVPSISAVATLYQVALSGAAITGANPTWAASSSWYASAVTAGHWVMIFTLTVNNAPPISTTYTITVMTNTGTGYTSTFTFGFTSAATGAANTGTVTVYYDVGITFTAPQSVIITVA
jgi:hypothetical protein